MKINKISMKPTGKVYLTFKFRNYKIYKALAEYIDNSTQSYFDNEKKLKKQLVIEIDYTSSKIIILDNAYGMNIRDLNQALKLGGERKKGSGRHQFGMGMKVASIWFTDDWRITTKKFGEKVGYKINIKMNELTNDIDPKPSLFSSNKNDHFTKIELLNLSNRRIAGKSAKKLKEVLGTVYKRDILSKKVKILINKEEVKITNFSFYDHEILGVLKKEVDIEFQFNNKLYRVEGYIGVRDKGSTSETSGGFALYDNNRVIIPNWRDSSIFKQSNSYTYQRLVGELDLIGFNVTSDKEEFDWHNGLKDEFIKQIKKTTEEYSKLAESIRFRLEPDTEKEIKEIKEIGERISRTVEIKTSSNIRPQKPINSPAHYKFKPKKIKLGGIIYNISVELNAGDGDFIYVKRLSNNKIKLSINRDHKFLRPKLSSPLELENYINAFTYQVVALFHTEENWSIEKNGVKYVSVKNFWGKFNEILEEAGENYE